MSATFCWSEASARRRGLHKGGCEYQEVGPWCVSTVQDAGVQGCGRQNPQDTPVLLLACKGPARRDRHLNTSARGDMTTDSPSGDTAQAGPGHHPHPLGKSLDSAGEEHGARHCVRATLQNAASLLATKLCPLKTYFISSLKPVTSDIFSYFTKETETQRV